MAPHPRHFAIHYVTPLWTAAAAAAAAAAVAECKQRWDDDSSSEVCGSALQADATGAPQVTACRLEANVPSLMLNVDSVAQLPATTSSHSSCLLALHAVLSMFTVDNELPTEAVQGSSTHAAHLY
jgi:hypothetical protein